MELNAYCDVIESAIKIHNVELINSKHFKYIGIWIGFIKFNIGNMEIEHRIRQGLFLSP